MSYVIFQSFLTIMSGAGVEPASFADTLHCASPLRYPDDALQVTLNSSVLAKTIDSTHSNQVCDYPPAISLHF